MKPARTALQALCAATALAVALFTAAQQPPTGGSSEPLPPPTGGQKIKPAAVKTPTPKRPVDTLKFPPLNPIQDLKVEKATLPDGLQLLLVEDHELPLVQMRAVVRGGKVGAASVPGLIDLFDEVHRTGGTASMPGDKVDEFLESIGASIESGVSDASSSLSAKMLKERVGDVLPLYAEFLMAPGFEQAKIDLAKTQLKSNIARRNDDPMGIGRREFLKRVFGEGSPYAAVLEYDQVDALTREDLLAFHRTFYRPDNTILAVWGDFSAPEMKARLEKAFAAWKAQGPAPKVPPFPVPPPSPSLNYAEKAGSEQTTVLMGHLGLRLDDPDYAAVYIMTDILGGGFSSRIFTQVRTLKALAYGAGGFMVPAYDRPGVFYFYTSTKPNTTAEAIATMLDEIKKIREAPVTDEELERSKQAYLNGYAFEFDSTDKIVNRKMTYLLYGYPEDFNVRLRAAVEKVTKDDVLKAAQKHLLPEKLSLVAVGDAKNFDKPLSTFGEVKTLDIRIPEPTPKEVIPAATPESLKAGTALLAAAAKARGEKALLGLKDLTYEGEVAMGGMSLKIKAVVAPPDRNWNEIQTPMGVMNQVLSGDRGWMSMGPKTRELPGAAVDEMRKGIPTEAGCAFLLQQVLQGKLQGQLIGKTDVEGAVADDVLVKMGDASLRLYVDAKGVLVGLKSHAVTQEGPADILELYSDWRDAGGLKVPFKTVQKVGGEEKQSSALTSVKPNAGYDAKIFEKPAAPPPPAK